MSATVLIVEDEPDVARYLSAALQANGYRPVVAGDVDSGLKKLQAEKPKLVCLDIMMPHQSGMALYVQLKQDELLKEIPVVIVSGIERAGEFDFRAYVSDPAIPPPERFMEKPVGPDEFIAVVDELVHRDRSPEERGGQ
jgi:DNA-binding response OmpR family regulator